MLDPSILPLFSSTLLSGGYNLLLGSGVSLDSRNGAGLLLRSTDTLRRDLCRLKGVNENTSISRVAALLTPAERREHLINSYSRCQPGPSLAGFSHFIWRRIFSLNIDDVIEALYEATDTHKKQSLTPLNFDSLLEPTPERYELHSIHLHGWVRKPDTGFVFSNPEYARQMRNLNPWMLVLSQILATEPFIIAGTSLNEIDLEYYLSHRSPVTPRRSKGPSLLIEPFPDAATIADCARYDLVLVKASFGEFLAWLRHQFSSPPSVADLVVPDVGTLFPHPESNLDLLRFFTDFELVAAGDHPLPASPTPFLYGRPPTWQDLNQHLDIPRDGTTKLASLVPSPSSASGSSRVALLLEDPGTGKSTAIRRVAHDLATRGQPVLAVRTVSRIDSKNAIRALRGISSPVTLLVDNLADFADQIVEILDAPELLGCVSVLAAERTYRRDHLDVVLRHVPIVTTGLSHLSEAEADQLIERYRSYGLVGTPDALRGSAQFARSISADPVAVAVCRILNDFRPLDSIVDSLWDAAPVGDREPYLAIALAQHCVNTGLRYSIAQAIAQAGRGLPALLKETAPLRITENPNHDEFAITLNQTFADRALRRLADRDSTTVLRVFQSLALALAPHVNRRAIILRSPEARLAGRLFDFDKITRPLLGSSAESFYLAVQKAWEWNSRYWEQRALLAAETDLSLGLQHARHAVSIEHHLFPLTTLAKLLLASMEREAAAKVFYDEAFDSLRQAIEFEQRRSRSSVHPYATLLSGTLRYLERGGQLTDLQRSKLAEFAAEAKQRFAGDPLVESALRRLDFIPPYSR